MHNCYFDKKGFWHECDNPNLQGNCIGCKYEHIIASAYYTLCHWCGKQIEARHPKTFCSKEHQNAWRSERMSYDNKTAIEGDMYWSDGGGAVPIYDIKELRIAQKEMLGGARI
ncbi:MAG: hypothetical protein WC329_02035 [Candidatus Omnitrophota bacterium]|jgi:hypothetical protein